MFKYVEFIKVETDNTVLEFRGSVEGVEVFRFDKDVVSLKSDDEAAIDKLIAKQPEEIGCAEITQDEFKTIVSESAQLQRIRNRVKSKIAEKYLLADEIAILKKSDDDVKRVVYNDYITECLALGNGLKAEIGY